MPADIIQIHQEVEIAASGEALFALVVDLPRYADIEPHVVSARWVTSGPIQAGSVAEVMVEIPFTVRAISRVFGAPRGLVTVKMWEPPTALVAEFDGRTVALRVAVQITERDGMRIADVHGVIGPRAQWAGVLLRPARPMLEKLVARSIERGLHRVEAALGEAGSRV